MEELTAEEIAINQAVDRAEQQDAAARRKRARSPSVKDDDRDAALPSTTCDASLATCEGSAPAAASASAARART